MRRRVLIYVAWLVAAAASGPAAAFSGTWETNFGELRLHEVEGYLIGDYRDRGVILAKVSGDCAAGVFTNGERNGRLRFNKRGSRFDGEWAWHGEALKDGWTGRRTGAAPRQLENFSRTGETTQRIDNERTVYDGRYNSNFGSVTLLSRDLFLIGDYADRGIVAGMWAGNRFVGAFTNGGRTGWFEFPALSKPGDFRPGAWGWANGDREGDWVLGEKVATRVARPDNMVDDVTCESAGSSEPEPAPEPAVRFDRFRPSMHGFDFVNYFDTQPIEDHIRGRNLPIPDLSKYQAGYGLCGGMAAAAADFYLNRQRTPSLTDQPEPGEALYDYLLARQIDSFGLAASEVATFKARMSYKDESVRYLTGTEELPTLLDRLRDGKLTAVGLINVDNDGNLWENHQVLAYRHDRVGDAWRVYVYDPNYPNKDTIYLRIVPKRVTFKDLPLGTRTLIRSRLGQTFISRNERVREAYVSLYDGGEREQRLRGIFVMPYERKQPPAAL